MDSYGILIYYPLNVENDQGAFIQYQLDDYSGYVTDPVIVMKLFG